MEKEKKNTGLYVLVAILCVLVLGLGSYIVYDKILSKPQQNENNDTTGNQTNNNDTKKIADSIISNNEIITEKVDFSNTNGKAGLYKQDDYYFFRGKVENNNLVFGTYNEDTYIYNYDLYNKCVQEKKQDTYSDYCLEQSKTKIASKGENMVWRIMRINSDNTVKLILDGTTKPTPYNEDTYNSNILKSQNGVNYNNSTVKSTIDEWYSNNIGNTDLDKYVVTSTFCNNVSGVQNSTSSYKIDNPTLNCPSEYQINLKAGIISADEYIFAGNIPNHSNKDYVNSYLKNDNISAYWWTMTGSHVYGSMELVYEIAPEGFISGDYVTSPRNTNNPRVARPVITLSSNLTIIGSGTQNDPYKIVK